jgi:cyclopropane fatty-acyl-phospholipid synthase-like methyltransferase
VHEGFDGLICVVLARDGDVAPIGIVLQQAESSGFEVRDVENLREHYVLTLRHWVHNLEDHAQQARHATDESTLPDVATAYVRISALLRHRTAERLSESVG